MNFPETANWFKFKLLKRPREQNPYLVSVDPDYYTKLSLATFKELRMRDMFPVFSSLLRAIIQLLTKKSL